MKSETIGDTTYTYTESEAFFDILDEKIKREDVCPITFLKSDQPSRTYAFKAAHFFKQSGCSDLLIFIEHKDMMNQRKVIRKNFRVKKMLKCLKRAFKTLLVKPPETTLLIVCDTDFVDANLRDI